MMHIFDVIYTIYCDAAIYVWLTVENANESLELT